MKKIAIVILAVFATSAFAMGPGHRGGEKMVEHMTQKLELTDAQSAQLTTVFEEQGEKMKALHDKSAATTATKSAKNVNSLTLHR